VHVHREIERRSGIHLRSPKVDDCVDAMNAAREGYLPTELFEKCTVGTAITAGDLAA